MLSLFIKTERVCSMKRGRIKKIILMTLGVVFYAAAIGLFLDPNTLAPGGISGISVILSRLIPIGTGTLILLFNVPILIAGAWKFGFRFICSTIYCTVLSSLMINIFSSAGALTQDRLLAALAGGAMIAVGLGLIFRNGATTGGMDIIVKFLRLKYPHMKTGSIFMAADSFVVLLSALVFRDVDLALYAALVVFVNSFLLDVVLYGRDGAKLIYIISDKSAEIAGRLLDELEIGVTYVHAEGAYSGKDKKVIMCVMRKQIYPKAEEIIKEEDPQSFMIVTGATEIFGEGYKNLFSEKI